MLSSSASEVLGSLLNALLSRASGGGATIPASDSIHFAVKSVVSSERAMVESFLLVTPRQSRLNHVNVGRALSIRKNPASTSSDEPKVPIIRTRSRSGYPQSPCQYIPLSITKTAICLPWKGW